MHTTIVRGAWAAALAALVGLTLSPGHAQAQTPLWDGLISYWALGEGAGDTANDTGPGGFVADTGTVRNSPTWITSGGPFNTGLQFTGTEDVFVPSSTDMDINALGVTLSAWVKLDLLPPDIPAGFMGIYDSEPDNYVLYLDRTTKELRFKVTPFTAPGSAERPGIPSKMLNTSEWQHVMGVFDGNRGDARIYLNGNLVDVHANPGLVDFVRAGQVAAIGSDPFVPIGQTEGTARYQFQGGITDVAVWNRALGPADAQHLYNNGVGNAVGAANPSINPVPAIQPIKPTAEPVVYYNFDNSISNQGTGGAAYDATLHDTPGVNDALYTATNFGQGLDLRGNPTATNSNAGTGDYLSVGYTMAEEGSITMRFAADKLYNWQTVWANSGNANDWEAWVYGDGRLAARVDRATASLLPYSLYNFDGSEQLTSHHYTFTWERDGDEVWTKLYVDGEFQGQMVTPWRDPGDTVFIGGGTGNHYGSGVYDEFRIYETALTEAEILYLSQTADEVVIAPVVPGDFNGDGNVDGADFVIWQTNFPNNSGTATLATGDANGDGNVDGADFVVWQTNFPTTGSVTPVPEPGAIGLLLMAGLSLVACRCVRGSRQRK